MCSAWCNKENERVRGWEQDLQGFYVPSLESVQVGGLHCGFWESIPVPYCSWEEWVLMVVGGGSGYFVAQGIYIYILVFLFIYVVPEFQGEPDDISKEKCKVAAKEVRFWSKITLLKRNHQTRHSHQQLSQHSPEDSFYNFQFSCRSKALWWLKIHACASMHLEVFQAHTCKYCKGWYHNTNTFFSGDLDT